MLMENSHKIEELFFEIEINTSSTEDGVCVYSCARAFRINFLLVFYKKFVIFGVSLRIMMHYDA